MDSFLGRGYMPDMSTNSITELPFMKMHGLGNDFVVVDARANPVEITPAMARGIAHRQFGPSSIWQLIYADDLSWTVSGPSFLLHLISLPILTYVVAFPFEVSSKRKPNSTSLPWNSSNWTCLEWG